MTTFTSQTKSQLAKLLATENIRIEHKKLHTASFDPKNRVLYCPIWKDMSGDLYDLLMGHEVGHALYTPADGWHDAACSNGKNFKAFLNVVEDARIEKKVKRKYPGLRPSFVRAYNDLMKKDFFGVSGKDLNDLSFINRLNLYTKSDYSLSIQFGAREKDLVDRVRSCETWEDVLKITGDIWEYSKEEQEQMMEDFNFPFDSAGSDYSDEEDFDDSYDDMTDSYGDGQDSDDGDDGDQENNNDGSGRAKQSKESSDGEETEETEKNSSVINRHKESEDYYGGGQFEPTCETDETFRRRESELLDEKSKDYFYVKFPKPVLENIITPAKRVHELLSNHYLEDASSIDQCVADFKSKNEKYVSLLAKEFEMRKAAKRFAKAKLSNTGDIDVSRLYKYQIDDNIFRKMMKVPNGKSHGLILAFDRSGSMHNNMYGSIEQMLIIALFCRKVNIPFVVYGFGNNINGRKVDFPKEQNESIVLQKPLKNFSTEGNEIFFGSVFMREYMNSKMSNSEFSKVLRNMVALMNSYPSPGSGYHRRYNSTRFWPPVAEELSNTPLVQSIVALEPITQQFRKMNNLDIVNTVIIHDGDADYITNYNILNEEGKKLIGTISPSYSNFFVTDGNKEYKIECNSKLSSVAMQWYTEKTGAKIFGFFITANSSSSNLRNAIGNQFYNEKGQSVNEMYTNANDLMENLKTYVATMKKEKFIISHKKGYDKFFLISGGEDLTFDDEFEFESEGKVSAKKLTTAFLKHNKKRQVNRILVNKFIEGIAAD
jgi:hypothetical protein